MGDSEIEKRLQDLEARVKRLEGNSATSDSSPSEKEFSVREFLNRKHPRTANDKVITLGYYLEHSRGYEAFTADDLKEMFRNAKLPAPSNVNDVINKNIAKGLIMEAGNKKDGKKAWVITASGEQVVENDFSKE